MTDVITEIRAVKDREYRPIIQPISGFVTGHQPVDVWRVQITIGKFHFLSKIRYAHERSAKAAVRRLSKKKTATIN